MSLELVWSFKPETPLEGMAADPIAGRVWATFAGGAFCLDGGGRVTHTTLMQGVPRQDPWPHYAALRLANLDGRGDPELIIPGTRRKDGASKGVIYNTLAAYSASGELLWEHERDARALEKRGERAVADQQRDVCIADLDGDGRDEIVISYTYAKRDGIRALNRDGTLRWTFPGASSETVTAGAIGPRGEVEIVATGPTIRFLNGLGQLTREIDNRFKDSDRNAILQFGVVRAARPAAEGPPVIIAADDELALACLNSSGGMVWRRSTEDRRWGHIMDACASEDGPWIAFATWRCRRVLVYDVRNGARVASIRTPGWERGAWHPRLAWLPGLGGDPPLLLVGNTFRVCAYRLAPSEREVRGARVE
jgi:hypothetical protein